MEPVSSSHFALIISIIGNSTSRIEHVLHKLNISHRYAKLNKENPSGMDFLWDIYEFNFDLVVVLDEEFPVNLLSDVLQTICCTDFSGTVFLISSRQLQMADCIVIPDNAEACDRLEQAVSFFIKQ